MQKRKLNENALKQRKPKDRDNRQKLKLNKIVLKLKLN